MDIYELREKVKLGLNGVILDTGEPLHTILTHDQINDIANTITHYLPKGYQFKMTNLNTEIFNKIGFGQSAVSRLHGDNNAAVLPSDNFKDMKHKIFIILYTLYLLGENVDNVLDDIFGFYQSFIINTLDLKDEIDKSNVPATSAMINDIEAVRINSRTGKLVPTTKTIKQFKNLL